MRASAAVAMVVPRKRSNAPREWEDRGALSPYCGASSDWRELLDELRQFAAERESEQFHSPRNLAMALAVEAAELMEPFQWLSEAESADLALEKRAQVEEEMADGTLYLVRLGDKLDVDLVAVQRKLRVNAGKYPAGKAREEEGEVRGAVNREDRCRRFGRPSGALPRWAGGCAIQSGRRRAAGWT